MNIQAISSSSRTSLNVRISIIPKLMKEHFSSLHFTYILVLGQISFNPFLLLRIKKHIYSFWLLNWRLFTKKQK